MRALHRLFSAVAAVLTFVSLAHAQDQMPWQPNLETAQQIAARTNRLVLVHFWAPWCQPCTRLEREVFSRADTAHALETNFVLVKLNVDEAPGTARLYGVSSLPTDVIVTPSGRLVSALQSPPTAAQYVTQMNQAAAGHRELTKQTQVSALQPPALSPQKTVVVPQNNPSAGGNVTLTSAGASSPSSVAPGNYVNPNPPAAPQNNPARSAGSDAPLAEQPQPESMSREDRYAEYLRKQQQNGQPRESGPPATVIQPAEQPASAPVAAAAPPVTAGNPNPPAPQTPPLAAAPPQPGYSSRAAYQPQVPAIQLPPGCPPLGLDGYCPVSLVERNQWVLGDKTWGVVHRGRTYIFLGPEEQKKFWANPDQYSPVMSGNDPVLALDNRVAVPGKREFGVYLDKKIYLFANESSRQRFEQDPKRYAGDNAQAQR